MVDTVNDAVSDVAQGLFEDRQRLVSSYTTPFRRLFFLF